MASVRWFIGWARFLRRLRNLERTVGMMRACPCCGAVLALGHEKVALLEIEPGASVAVCRWGVAELKDKLALKRMRKARGA
ncbi:MAG TPA: hypothetical protein VFG76_06885 [Candidatus Polarisedimenticolia bacterium]|nr:hypothetical protein [Candidatus Polarisedimenticolia bacterium]